MKKGKLLKDHCIAELLARGCTDDDMKRPDGKAMGRDELRELLPWDEEGYLSTLGCSPGLLTRNPRSSSLILKMRRLVSGTT
jgi:hypothetical protein